MRMGRLFHLGYMGRSPTVTGKEGSSIFAFTAEEKHEHRGGEGAQELCWRCQERFGAPCGRGTQLCREEQWKHPRNTRKACSEQPETKPPPGFRTANWVGALLVTHPILPKNRESRIRAPRLCRPSAFTRLCTIFPLASSNNPALLHILPCWPGTWARAATARWMQQWGLLLATAKESQQGESLAVSSPSVSALTHASHLPCLLSLATTKKFVGI